MGMLHRSLSFDGNSVDVEKRTVGIIWSSGEKVLRKNWGGSSVYEELDMSNEAINLTSLNDRAPFLIDHNSASVRNQIGIIEPGSASIQDGKGVATVRFSKTPNADEIFQKIEEGILSKVSVGYSIDKVERIRAKGDEDYDTILVRKWTPKEVSLVVFPADSRAGVRSIEEEEFNLREEIKEVQMDVKEIVKKERERISEIQSYVRKNNLEDSFAQKLIDEEVSINECRKKILDIMEERSKKEQHIPTVTGGTPVESDANRNSAIATALEYRLDNSIKLDDSSKRYASASMVEIARIVSKADSEYSPDSIIKRALSTSDFPMLLANVMNKSLRKRYTDVPRTYQQIVTEIPVKDFKPIYRLQRGDGPLLLPKSDNGQYQEGKFSESQEVFKLQEWGRKITFTRQMLINDDLNAMTGIIEMLSSSAVTLEGDLAWGALTSQTPMSDGLPLFHEKHGNIAKNGSSISAESIFEGKLAMRRQRGLDGARIRNEAKFLIVPATLELDALRFMAPTNPVTDDTTNPFKSSMTLIVESRLDDFNPYGWFLASSPSDIDLILMLSLQGQGLHFESEVDFGSDGILLKSRFDRSSGVGDYRGFYYDPGQKLSKIKGN